MCWVLLGGGAGMEEPLGKLVGLVRYGSANQAQGQVQWLWASAVKTLTPTPSPAIQGELQEGQSQQLPLQGSVQLS